MKRCFFLFITITLFAAGCQKKKNATLSAKVISDVVSQMTDLMVHDITNPPLAARFFSYALLAGYEVVSQNNIAYKSMHRVLNKYPDLKKQDSITGYSYQVAAVLAMLETAKKMQPSGRILAAYEAHFIDSCLDAGFDEDEMNSSKRY